MKKICYILLAGLASVLTTPAQTDTAPPVEPTVATNAVATPAPATSAPDTTVTAVATTSTLDTNVPVAVLESVTNASVTTAVEIPDIKFSDVAITTAIENLARLANINYMLDPKIGYGLPDANGQSKAEPTLSIRWKKITAEKALLALLENYNLQLIHDKKTGIDRITTKDPTALPPLFTKVVQLKYAGVSNIVDAAKSVLTDPRSKVLTDARSSQLVVVATDPEQLAVESLVASLDKPTRQVLIETRLVEISTNPKTKKGIDWSGTLQGQKVAFGNALLKPETQTTTSPGFGNTAGQALGSPSVVANTANGFGDMGFLNADGLSAVMSFLNSSSDAQIMSTPRIVTLDNEQANISVTRGYPVFNVQAGTQNTAGGSSVTYSNVGTTLHVTPRISANDYIWLRVLPEVSSFFGNFPGPVTGTGSTATQLTAPIFDVRTLETQVLIPNANTLVLGGLVQDNPRQDNTKVPLLGDIPGLGFLFRSSDKEVSKVNLVIFITPTIVKDSDFNTSLSANFLKSKPQTMKDPLNPNTAWDGPMPVGNWSDPLSGETIK